MVNTVFGCSENSHYNNTKFNYYHSLFEDNIEKEIKNYYTNKYSDEEIINMLDSL